MNPGRNRCPRRRPSSLRIPRRFESRITSHPASIDIPRRFTYCVDSHHAPIRIPRRFAFPAGCSSGARGAMLNLDYVSAILEQENVTAAAVEARAEPTLNPKP